MNNELNSLTRYSLREQKIGQKKQSYFPALLISSYVGLCKEFKEKTTREYLKYLSNNFLEYSMSVSFVLFYQFS
jgi:hypothetical protein